MASQHINAWSELEQISLTLRDGISPWYSPQPTSTRCRTKVWKKKKMNWSFDSCCKMFVCNFCENSCSLSGQDNVKSVFSSASFTETRNCQHIFEITEDFFYFVIFTPRKKETRHLEVSHDRSLGVWCKGFVNMTKVSDKSDQSQYLEISWFMGFRGFGASTSRIFVALFDYDPPTMSPNPEACEEELPFREGQVGWSSVWYGLSCLLWNISSCPHIQIIIVYVNDRLIIIFIKETLSLSLCSLSR